MGHLRACIAVLSCTAALAAIVVPNAAQLRYAESDFIALIHYNMGTYAHNGDPCCDETNWNVLADYATGETRYPSTFAPSDLNISQWFESITGLGCSIAILTAKHGCGFTLWPTEATLPDGELYGYSVGTEGAAVKDDVLAMFVAEAEKHGVGYGFYYSIMKNYYLCRGFSGDNICMDEVLPGQHNLTDDEHKAIATQQVTELWTKYGNLTEIWVDSALDGLGDLMVQLQPQAAGTPLSPTGWCGTESGYPVEDVGAGPIWNMNKANGSTYMGDPDGTVWVPKFCDPQLFVDHIWFWEPDLEVRSLETLIPIYHEIVGRGMIMELAFSPDRDGLIQDTHEVVYKQLGNWTRHCYGHPLAETSVPSSVTTASAATTAAGEGGGEEAGGGVVFDLFLESGMTFDRFMLREELALGQRVRNYTISLSSLSVQPPVITSPFRSSNSSQNFDSLPRKSASTGFKTLVKASAIGRKAIHLLEEPVTVEEGGVQLRLTITSAVASPMLSEFSVFKPCPTA